MNDIPIVAFSAWSGTGKTTILEKLIHILKQKGLRLAVIKHDAHEFEIDKEGKDSWRFTQAGADVMILSSEAKTAVIEQRQLGLKELLLKIQDVDLILVEGYNDEELPRIGISRKATGRGLRLPVEQHIAVITDEEMTGEIPVFALDDVEGVAEFLLDKFLAL